MATLSSFHLHGSTSTPGLRANVQGAHNRRFWSDLAAVSMVALPGSPGQLMDWWTAEVQSLMLQRGPRVPCQRAEPLPEPVRGSHGHGWPPGRACAPLGNSPSPSSCPLGSHCLTVRHRAAFRALPIVSSRDKMSASSSLSERGTASLPFPDLCHVTTRGCLC